MKFLAALYIVCFLTAIHQCESLAQFFGWRDDENMAMQPREFRIIAVATMTMMIAGFVLAFLVLIGIDA